MPGLSAWAPGWAKINSLSDKEAPPAGAFQPGFFYGYIIVAAAFFILIAYSGARSAFGIFFDPMSSEFGWSSAALSIAFSISIVMDGLIGIIMGRLADRIGPRLVLTFSGCLIGLGYFLTSRVTSLWQMYLIYGVLIGFGMGGGFVPIITNIPRWFIARRGLMTGIVLTGMGVGTLAAPPIANWLISTYDWRSSYIILSVAIVLIMVLPAQFLKRDPAHIGQSPFNKNTTREQKARSEVRSYTLPEAVRTRQFWWAFGLFASLGFVIFALTVHLVPHIINLGISASIGAGILAVTGGANIIGRLTLGSMADRIGNIRIYIIGFILASVTIFGLIFISQVWQFYIFAVVFGVGQGGLGSAQAPLVAELFGLKSHGLIFGTCGFGAMLGGAIGPFFVGYLFDVTGAYRTAFIVCVAVSLLGLAFSLLLSRNMLNKARLLGAAD